VPKVGLEPTRLAPLPPQGSVYTNFTTSAAKVFVLRYFEWREELSGYFGTSGAFGVAGALGAAGTSDLGAS
jgi:hypothetical protein